MSASASTQAKLAIDFLVIGGGVSGLACAIALRRVGHRVVVLEREKEIGESDVSRGVRMPPNLSKILYHWDLKSEVYAFAAKSKQIQISRLETGVRLGTHYWDEEVLRETRGEFLFAHLSDLRKMMYNVAVKHGATVRLDTTAVAVDPERRAVTLASGETLTADVIVGADGVSGLIRPLLLKEQKIQEATEPKLCMYSAIIPRSLVEKDPESKRFYEPEVISMFSFFGNGQSVISHPIGGSPAFTFCLYRPWDEFENAPAEGMRNALADVEPRLRNLAPLISHPRRFPVFEYPPLEDWVDQSGRLVVVGAAAHPIPSHSTQFHAMGVEDGAVLAKLFSHLTTQSQISEFLYAFQELRQPRCETVLKNERDTLNYMGMPNCPEQETRDQAMIAKSKTDTDLFVYTEGEEESAEWAEIKTIFGYDCEDEADNWWVSWGLLRQRSLESQ
ncbi:6-hydroxynicotinate 3-monooxygenase [Mycena sanguinolenta]|uniref:6-hydroxynicotinate 3-monooxygenase n=1 Tax=Mycena sanguinolenta TaxID=230812 RepID=A0A8H7DIK1_9AGAR|nr:6-hydroxynicotinate 3-monooxygenase [Mycena sanguinolenta]